MKTIFILTKIFFKEMFSNGDFFENIKTGKKRVGKIIAYTLLILYCVGVFGFMYVSTISTLHQNFAIYGIQDITPTLVCLIGFLLTFIFGFMVSISTYVTSANEEIMFSMPIKTKDLFTAKFLCTYLNQLLLGAAVILIGLGIYGYYEKLLTNPLFYIEAILSCLAIPMLSVGICYLFLIILLTCFKFLRKKNLLMTAATILLVAFFLVFYFSFQKSINSMIDPELFLSTGQLGSVTNVVNIASFFPPINWFSKGIVFCTTGENLKSIGYILLLVVVCISIPLIILPLLSPLYKRSLAGFNESKIKKIEKGKEKEFVKADIKSTPILTALFKRDVKAVLREASWFSNGPLSLIIFPVIFGISFGVSFSQAGIDFKTLPNLISMIIPTIRMENPALLSSVLFYITMIGGLVACLMGTMTSISATSISREGKGFQNILALPFPLKKLITAKMLHAMLYSFFSSLLIFALLAGVSIWLKPSFTITEYLLVFLNFWWISLILAFIIHIIDMLIDVCHPKITWENPVAVFKQNLMTVVSIFLSMGLIGILVFLAFVLDLPKNLYVMSVINLIFTIIAVPSWILFQKFAVKRLSNLY